MQNFKFLFLCLYLLLVSLFGYTQMPNHVILISIDGLHPDMYLDKAWPTPNLQLLMNRGTYADHMLSVFPAYTHPSHAAMETGALPARSGIAYNQPSYSHGEWYWYYNTIKAPTIWAAIKNAGMTTAAIMWPNTVDGDITYNLSEIWDADDPDDRASVVRQHAKPKGIYEEIEQNATGKLDKTNMNDDYLIMDENAGRMAGYIFKKYKPNFLALHFATVDGREHSFGRDGDFVRLAIEANDRAIGDVLEAIEQSGLKDSTTVIIVGDHGFSTIHQVMHPNNLLKDLPVKFTAAGGSCFLYGDVKQVPEAIKRLNNLPEDQRKLFRIIERKELDKMGADSSALIALAAVPGTVFSGAMNTELISPTSGGHHGYDPNIPDMWTGFIAAGAGINIGGHIKELTVTDIAPLITSLLGIKFHSPDGKLPAGIINKN
jgi:predicted AlkP superfamily pyrophosphatase or phosphodiesterase